MMTWALRAGRVLPFVYSLIDVTDVVHLWLCIAVVLLVMLLIVGRNVEVDSELPILILVVNPFDSHTDSCFCSLLVLIRVCS
jgi:hypothetical protein